MLRNLRITVAVASLVACMLLSALWVRSYTWIDKADGDLFDSWYVFVRSNSGRVVLIVDDWPFDKVLQLYSRRASESQSENASANGAMYWQYEVQKNPEFTTRIVMFPYMFPVILAGVLAAVLGIRRPFQFSLRTLLIAMTITAAWLGLIGWLVR